ncbi:uncharacterized protein LOC129234534 [Uloborus diversus]|uniref:uncharacterized protein LOC129234534 n=1 Tax=Uloborus diversus TaxID=327109 RepID=UPI0024099F1E|nr:uncharacterized protein LOC129234534 [Uloborus diversus]
MNMVLISRCCCWRSVRKGSFASGIFTLSVYLFLLAATVFQARFVSESIDLLIFNIIMLIFSFFCVLSSVLLLVGLCVDNRLLLLPWIASVSVATTLEFVASLYFIPDLIENPVVTIFFILDISFCALSVYCILCVVSQYQQYILGRGRAGQSANCQPIPTVRFQPSMCGPSQNKTLPSVSFQVSHQNGACKAGNMHLMVPTNSSSITSKSMAQTDMSSMSDDQSSCDMSRASKASMDESSASEEEEIICVNSLRLPASSRLKVGIKAPSIIIETDEEESSLSSPMVDSSRV